MSNKPLLAKRTLRVDQTTRRFVNRAKRNYREVERLIEPNYLTTDPGSDLDLELMRAMPELRVNSAVAVRNDSNIREFIANGRLKSVSGRQGHIVAANLAFSNPLDRGGILTLMDFVSDGRFVAPGCKTLVSISIPQRTEKQEDWERVLNDTLYREQGEWLTYGAETVGQYIVVALSEACSALAMKALCEEERSTSRGIDTYLFQLELSKAHWSPEFPNSRSRITWYEDGSSKIGGLWLLRD